MDNNNYNNYNRDEHENGYQQNAYNSYYTAPNYQDYGNVNEVVYKPEKKKGRGKKVLAGIVGLLTVAAIGATSIVGYNLIRGDSTVKTDSSSASEWPAAAAASSDDSVSSDSAAETRDLPSIVQLASPSDAMSIPEIVNKNSSSVVGINCVTSQGIAMGTGIIMSEDGYIITNAHVVEGAQSISVKLPSSYADDTSDADAADELTIGAELIGKDTMTDIAVLKVNKTGLTKAEFGKSSDLQVGEVAIVIGNPLSMNLANSVTAGIISALNRSITIEDRTMNCIQTDASINNGNSGGPLINAYGQVVGITSAKVTSTYGEGLGFAIPIDEAIPIIEELIKNGRVTGRPALGVSGEDISEIYAKYYNMPSGFRVKLVNSGSAAEKAGIQVNDIIIGIEGKLISSLQEFNQVKNKYKAGDTVKISVYRDGEIVDLDVTLDEAATEEESAEKNAQNNDDAYNKYREFFNQFPF